MNTADKGLKNRRMRTPVPGITQLTRWRCEGEKIMLAKTLWRWLLVVIAVPIAAAGARKLSRAVESRRGPSRGTALLRQGADTLERLTGRRSRRRTGRRR
jgi:hypothetical protein